MSGKRRLDACAAEARKMDLLAPEFELLDPNPDIHALFLEFNGLFFDGKLAGCEVKWSPRMTLCAGLCSFQPSSGFCSIRLSVPLLKLRPRADLINTLLHEMIHAFLFVSSPVRDHDDHGPLFQSHMHRINARSGTAITIFHAFHDEVDAYRQHWWQCDGACRHRAPYFGVVKRAMNRAPGPHDTWWADHERTCGGVFTKIKEPEGYGTKQRAKLKQRKQKQAARERFEAFFPVDATSTTSKKDTKPVVDMVDPKAPPRRRDAGGDPASAARKKPKPSDSPRRDGSSRPNPDAVIDLTEVDADAETDATTRSTSQMSILSAIVLLPAPSRPAAPVDVIEID